MLNRSGKNLTSTSTSVNCATLIAIIEGKGNNRGQIGMAKMDISTSELTLCQFVDTNAYTLLRTRLSIFEVAEVVLPEENEKSSARILLLDMIQNTCPKTKITTLQRRYFNDSLGIDLVTTLNVEECSNVDASVFKKYFCMSAAAALIKYVEYIQNILYAHNSLKIIYEAVENSCFIDVNSWTNLGLFHADTASNNCSNSTPNSLFEILNRCLTRGGTRTLRTYLLQPSASVKTINSRLDVVQELVRNQAMCDRIRSVLSHLHDLQQLVSLCTYTTVEQNTNREESKRVIRNKIIQVIELKRLLDAIKKISEVISHSNSAFFLENKKILDDCRLEAIAEFVNDKISSELTTRKRKGLVASSSKDQILFAVAESQHVLLDVARRTYQELVALIVEFGAAQLKDILGAQLCYSQSRGYHFSLHANDPYSINLPSHCIQVVFNKASLTFTTRELIKYNDRLLQTENEILGKSNLVLDQLIGSIREYIPALYKCAELVSLLDYYTALASYCANTQTVRPSFGKELLIVQGRHPILDCRGNVVPNDTRASNTESRFAIIAGPNMAGKSTYMRQVCMLQVLAQMGCMVPAESASFVLMTRIFSRVGHNDDLAQNLSGFAVEMSEMTVILQNANATSLIIVDELARSTSTEEGIGICYAICEKLLSTKAFVFFATHFLDMAQLELNYAKIVKNYHFASVPTIDPTTRLETLAPSPRLHEGPYEGPLYGLELAELATFPQRITQEARQLAERIRKAKENCVTSSFFEKSIASVQ